MMQILGQIRFEKAGTEESVSIFDTAILDEWRIPFGYWFDQMVDWMDLNAAWVLDTIKWPFDFLLKNFVNSFLLTVPWFWVVLFTVVFGALFRTPRIGIQSGFALALCGLLGQAYWLDTMRTVGMVIVSVALCALIGIPLGVLCARQDGVWNVVRPVMDAMQVIHSFTYMVPFVFFFSIGVVPATMVTMIYALPPLVRLTNLGIRQVPEDVVEASRAYGAPESRVLVDVQLPLARPAIMTGLNQCLMLSIAMVGIAAIMGASGLGLQVFRAVQNLDVGLGFSAGFALFLVSVVLDRLSQPEGDNRRLFERITGAVRARRSTDEEILSELAERGKDKQTTEVEWNTPATPNERKGLFVAGVGGFVALVSLFLTWGSDAGLIAGHSRAADLDLAGQSFNGFAASGGNWFGFFVFGAACFIIAAAITTIRNPGSISKLMGAHGSAIASFIILISSLTYLIANTAQETVNYSHGVGLFVSIAGGAIGVLGSLFAVQTAPLSPHRPLTVSIAWGRVLAGVTALLLVLIGSISGWTFDERGATDLPPEAQAEINVLREEVELSPALVAINNSKISSLINKYRMTVETINDGITPNGAGLSYLAIPLVIIGLLTLLPAVGVFGFNEHLRWRWSVITAGIGAGISIIGLGWIISLARVSDLQIVTGAGAFLTALGGAALALSSRSILNEFNRKKVYEDPNIGQN
ncbi:MAG TPA: ABC transporter permease subunit, partial [Acidimicrobiales bacterium]|nr:ABC transporter permease subunit [Acidimicrobiales bacterium]